MVLASIVVVLFSFVVISSSAFLSKKSETDYIHQISTCVKNLSERYFVL